MISPSQVPCITLNPLFWSHQVYCSMYALDLHVYLYLLHAKIRYLHASSLPLSHFQNVLCLPWWSTVLPTYHTHTSELPSLLDHLLPTHTYSFIHFIIYYLPACFVPLGRGIRKRTLAKVINLIRTSVTLGLESYRPRAQL